MGQIGIRDIKPPLNFQADYTLLITVLAIAVVSVLIFLAIYLLKKRAGSKESGQIISPKKAHDIAYEALRLLKSRNLPGSGHVKEYYFEISKIARAYIENRFSLKAPEMTTEEFLYSVKDSSILTPKQKNIVKEFLNRCDLVKFAKYGPAADEIEASFDTTKKLVDETKIESREKVSIE
jgi:hypothetical protein